MKKLVSLFAGLLFFLIAAPATHAAEEITQFHSDITLRENASIGVSERIEYTTDQDKHGIYRYIPYRYQRHGLTYTTKIGWEKITDASGRPIPFERSVSDGFVTYKIGDPDKTFSGPMTYVISYEVSNAAQQFAEHEELYWDITGEGWQIPIASTSATIHSHPADIIDAECFSGTFGGDDNLCQLNNTAGKQVSLTYPEMITYGENVTVAVKVPKGSLTFPTPLQKALQAVIDNYWIIFLALPAVIMFTWWYRSGRDRAFTSMNVFNHDPSQPQTMLPLLGRRQVPLVYEPLKDLTPGEAGAMLDEKADTQDVIAELIELAHLKYLKIERTEKKKFIFAKETDYVFTQLKAADGKLSAAQSYLMEQLFESGNTVTMSSLKGSFHTHMEETKKLIFQSLTDKGLFVSNPTLKRGLGLVAAAVMTVLGAMWMFQLLEQGIWLALPVMGVSALVSFICGYALPAKTAHGRNLSLQAQGLRETIQRGQWREKIKEKKLFIEEVLPFAVALGVVDQLSRDMEHLNLKPPSYMAHSGLVHHAAFNSMMRDFSQHAGSTLAYNPSSSSSGGSGFSGGSSGGGGGGGGGGSW